MTRQTNITECRVEFLKQFDYYVRDIIGDEEITCEVWLVCGVPDGSTEADLREIALDDGQWQDCVECFRRCCSLDGVI